RGVAAGPAGRERGRGGGVDAHLAEDLRLVTLRAPGEDRDRDAPAGRRLPLLGHLLHVLVPHRSLGDDRRELDGRLRLRGGGPRQEDEQVQDACYCLMRFAVHSICPIPATSAFPFTMESPSRSPVSTTVIGPCGVCAVIVTFIALPSTVPSTGTSPIWLPNVPESLPPSTARLAF